MECIFCEIVKKERFAKIIFENEKVMAFQDIDPKAPYHFLIIPKKHIEKLTDLKEDDRDLISEIFFVAKDIAKNYGFKDKGFRIVTNCGKDGGQSVFHLHFHLLGGRHFGWPPG